MIRIVRGPEPSKLPQIRKNELQRVRAIRAERGTLAGDDIGREYTAARSTLREVQFEKCCYCEWREQAEYNDVEHYRPKSEARRGPAFTDTTGYWWLAWSWENLLFACSRCNRSGKNAEFPLEPGSVPLVPDEMPPGRERPLLLDPAGPTWPMEHIRFAPIQLQGSRERWRPFAVSNSRRGLETIRILSLDRDTLIEDYTKHVERHVRPRCRRLEQLAASADARAAREEWQETARSLLAPWEQFVALSHDALLQLLPEELRAQLGINPTERLMALWEEETRGLQARTLAAS